MGKEAPTELPADASGPSCHCWVPLSLCQGWEAGTEWFGGRWVLALTWLDLAVLFFLLQ